MTTRYFKNSRNGWNCLSLFERTEKKQGFTLIELLVVIAIISLLVSILLPSLNKAKELARKTACMSNLRTIGMGIVLYAEDHNGNLPDGSAIWYPKYWDRTELDEIARAMEMLNEGISSTVDPEGRYGNVFKCPSINGDYGHGWGDTTLDYAILTMGDAQRAQSGQFPVETPSNLSGSGTTSKPFADVLASDSVAYCAGSVWPYYGSQTWFGNHLEHGGTSFHLPSGNGDPDESPAGCNTVYTDGHVQFNEKGDLNIFYNAGGVEIYY